MRAFIADFRRYSGLLPLREAFDVACTLRRTRNALRRAGYLTKS